MIFPALLALAALQDSTPVHSGRDNQLRVHGFFGKVSYLLRL